MDATAQQTIDSLVSDYNRIQMQKEVDRLVAAYRIARR